MTRPVLFLDDGGVMNDNRLRGEQWPPLVAEFFAPRLGGIPEAWAEANRSVITRILEPASWQARLQSASDYRNFEYQYELDWISGMCELVNVPIPDEEQCYQLAVEATVAIIPRIRSAFPGAADAIRALHERGYTLYTASGSHSREVDGYLEVMGVRGCFQRLYGADLIDTFKAGPAFYERIFADSGVDPASALVVDDLPHALAWARQVRARTVLVGAAPAAEEEANIRIASLAQLPDMIHRFD
jgi:HAD superfamily hydrolase (TIGR01509 family)